MQRPKGMSTCDKADAGLKDAMGLAYLTGRRVSDTLEWMK